MAGHVPSRTAAASASAAASPSLPLASCPSTSLYFPAGGVDPLGTWQVGQVTSMLHLWATALPQPAVPWSNTALMSASCPPAGGPVSPAGR